MTTKGKAYSTFTFLLIGGFSMYVGDQIAATQLSTGRGIFAAGAFIFLIPFLFAVLRGGRRRSLGGRRNVILTARTPSVKKSVRRHNYQEMLDRQRQEVAKQIIVMEEREEQKRKPL